MDDAMAAMPDRTVYQNGRVVDGHRHIANGYLVTEGTTIVSVGSGEPKRGASSGNVRLVDLAGRTVLPGFIDGHVHLTMNAEASPKAIVSPADQTVIAMAISGESASSPGARWTGGGNGTCELLHTLKKFFCRRLGEFGTQTAEFLAALPKAAAVRPKRHR